MLYCYFTPNENVSLTSGSSLTSFSYKINNNFDGSFTFITKTSDTVPKKNVFLSTASTVNTTGAWFSLLEKTRVGDGQTTYTYQINWGRTFAFWCSGTSLFWDRNGKYSDELLNYEDTELMEAIRCYFNLNYHNYKQYSYTNIGTSNTVVYNLLDKSSISPTIYAVFAVNANDNNFMSCPLYQAMMNITGGTPVKNTFSSIVFIPMMEFSSFSLGNSFTNSKVNNSINDLYIIQNDENFSKKFLGYYKAPSAFNLADAYNYFAGYFSSSMGVQYAGLRYCRLGLSATNNRVQKYCVCFQMILTSYINQFKIPFGIPITTNYTYTPSSTSSTTQLDHLHLTQVFDYKIGNTSAPYPSLLAKFGLSQSTWSNLSTYYYNTQRVNMGFADGVILQSMYNSDSKIYYGSSLPYIYDGFVDWNNANKTALNASITSGLSGILGGVFGTYFHAIAKTVSGGNYSNTYQQDISDTQKFAYNAIQWIKGAPTYEQQIRQAQISNPANLQANADASGMYGDLQCYFTGSYGGLYGARAIPYEISYAPTGMIQYANDWLKRWGFGGVSRYMTLGTKPTYYSGYARLTKCNANPILLRNAFKSYYESLVSNSTLSQFLVRTYEEVCNEAYEWMCGGFYQ